MAQRHSREVGRSRLRSADNDGLLERHRGPREIRADGNLSFVEIVPQDGSGIAHTLRDQNVTVSMSGSGALQGLGSADPRSVANRDTSQ